MVARREQLAEILDRRVLGPGAVIFRAGEAAGSAYIVFAGEVGIHTGQGAEARLLTTVRAGQMFGELALVAGGIRTATASTRDGCELLVVPATKVQEKLAKSDPFVRYWIEYLSERVVDLTGRIEPSAPPPPQAPATKPPDPIQRAHGGRVAITVRVSMEMADILRDVAAARMSSGPGESTAPKVIEAVLTAAMADLAAEAVSFRNPPGQQ